MGGAARYIVWSPQAVLGALAAVSGATLGALFGGDALRPPLVTAGIVLSIGGAAVAWPLPIVVGEGRLRAGVFPTVDLALATITELRVRPFSGEDDTHLLLQVLHQGGVEDLVSGPVARIEAAAAWLTKALTDAGVTLPGPAPADAAKAPPEPPETPS